MITRTIYECLQSLLGFTDKTEKNQSHIFNIFWLSNWILIKILCNSLFLICHLKRSATLTALESCSPVIHNTYTPTVHNSCNSTVHSSCSWQLMQSHKSKTPSVLQFKPPAVLKFHFMQSYSSQPLQSIVLEEVDFFTLWHSHSSVALQNLHQSDFNPAKWMPHQADILHPQHFNH